MCLFKKERKYIQIKFGVPFFDLFDPRFPDFSVPVSVRGSVSFQIKNYKKFLKQQGYKENEWDNFQDRVRNAVICYVKESVVNIPDKYQLSVVQLERKIELIGNMVKADLFERIKKEFKILLTEMDITAIEVDKYSEGYAQLKAVTQDVTLSTILAETEAKVRDILDKQRIESQNYEETLEIKNQEEIGKLKRLIPVCIVGGIIIVALLGVMIYLLFFH